MFAAVFFLREEMSRQVLLDLPTHPVDNRFPPYASIVSVIPVFPLPYVL